MKGVLFLFNHIRPHCTTAESSGLSRRFKNTA